VLTQEQYDNDTSTVREIISALTGAKSKDAPTSHGFPKSFTESFSKVSDHEEMEVSLSFLLQNRCSIRAYKKSRIQADSQMLDLSPGIPVLMGTRASRLQSSSIPKPARSRVPRLVARSSLSPLASWIGKQLNGQIISKRHLDENGLLSTILDGYPNGLLAIPATDSVGPRIVVPRDKQMNLITATQAEIHHQGHTKVHHNLYPLYY
jgi:hypothetical protein